MKPSELKSFNGATVEILLDGCKKLAELRVSEETDAYLQVPPATSDGWTNIERYTLSDEEIATMKQNGPMNFYSNISINKE